MKFIDYIASDKRLWLFLPLVAIVFFVLNAYTPISQDDWFYKLVIGTSEPVNTFGDLIRSQWAHYFEMNGRFVPHTFVQLFDGIMGKGVFNVCNTLMFLLYLLLIPLVARPTNRADYCLISLLLLVVCLVFNEFGECFLWLSGACNYLWTSVFFLIFHHLMQRNNAPKSLLPLLFLYAIFCGNTHEGLIMGAICGYALYFFLHRSELSTQRIVMLVGLFLGVLIIVLSPGSQHRASGSGLFDTGNLMSYVFALLSFSNLRIFYLMLLLLAYSCWKKATTFKSFVKDNLFYFTAILAVAGFAFIVKQNTYRSHYGVEFFSLILVVKLLSLYQFRTWLIHVFNVLLLLASVPVSMSAKDNYAEFEQIEQQLSTTRSGIVATDEAETDDYLGRYVVRTITRDDDEFNRTYFASDVNNKYIADIYHVDSVLFLPEPFVTSAIAHPMQYANFSLTTSLPFYAKRIGTDQVHRVRMLLRPATAAEVPFYLRPFASKLGKFTAKEVESNDWGIISLHGNRYLIVPKNHAVDFRLKEIVYE